MTASPTDTATGIDRAAPVFSRHEVVVAAPLPVVWALHADVAGRPIWNTAGMDVSSTATQVDPPHRVVCGGTAHGITGMPVRTLTEVPSGVLVRTEESWDGDVVRVSVPTMHAVLDASLQTGLRGLRLAAETRPTLTIGELS